MTLFDFAHSQGWLSHFKNDRLKTLSADALFDLLLRLCPVSEADLLEAMASAFKFVNRSLDGVSPDKTLLSTWDLHWMKAQGIMPVFHTGKALVVATCNPFNPELDRIKAGEGLLEVWRVNRFELLQYLYPQEGMDPLLASLLDAALERGASDLVVHATSLGGEVTFRVSGVLIPIRTLAVKSFRRLVHLIKLESHLDVGERQRPQEGRIAYGQAGASIEGRVSLIPTLYGEDAVIRFFYSDYEGMGLESLGFLEAPLASLREVLSQRSGLILITGPTGSGKTTTLYAMLRELSQDRYKSIVSLEDPIESSIPGVRQSQVSSEGEYSYDEGLKSMLRQDPDVLMIGEIRDSKTAHKVLEAAYTGHLVLSTLHTSSVMASLLRYLSFGCDAFMLRYALKGVLSQTLVPKKCGACQGAGCLICDFKGIKGRQLLMEFLSLKDPLTVSTDPAKWIEEGAFYPYNADTDYKEQQGLI